MKVLVVGSGGREHALVWKLSESPLVEEVYVAPGNAGTALEKKTKNIALKADDVGGLLDFALNNKIDLTVVGPEIPLSLGIVDKFTVNGLKIFGPSKGAAKIEASKIFAKETMFKAHVPTAFAADFSSAEDAKAYVHKRGAPVVVKADGLAAGKGVFVARTVEEALAAVDEILINKAFGNTNILVEDFLQGAEVSYLAITDGKNIIPLPPAQDHKQVFDGDRGANTGGMGAYSPADLFTNQEYDSLSSLVIEPIIKEFASKGIPYRGVLYAGLMVSKKPDGSKAVNVLEYNCRFGDPETQVIMARLESDLAELLLACALGDLSKAKVGWKKDCAVCVVMASGGYPGKYSSHFEISGIEAAAERSGVKVLHSGTKHVDGSIYTDGGRVLSVVGMGDGVDAARKSAYGAVEDIFFEDMHYRKDIGNRGLKGDDWSI